MSSSTISVHVYFFFFSLSILFCCLNKTLSFCCMLVHLLSRLGFTCITASRTLVNIYRGKKGKVTKIHL